MSKVVDVNLDQNEIELKFDNMTAVQKVQYGKIAHLKFLEDSVKKWFRTKQFRVIEVHVRGKEIPFIISGEKVKALDQIEPYLRQMAEKHHITIIT